MNNHGQQSQEQGFTLNNKSCEMRNGELGSKSDWRDISGGVEDHLPNTNHSSVDLD